MEKGKGGASRPRPRFWPAGRSWPSPPALAPSSRSRRRRVHARGRPCRDAVARRQHSAAAWRACGDLDVPWSATRFARPRPPSPPLPDALLRSLSRSLSRPHAAAAPPLAIAVEARSSYPRQLRPPPSHPPPPATPPHPSAPRARAQSRSVSLARPVELTGVSRSSGDLSARAVLPLLNAIACIIECVSFALALRNLSCR